jgi:hypothetical protein
LTKNPVPISTITVVVSASCPGMKIDWVIGTRSFWPARVEHVTAFGGQSTEQRPRIARVAPHKHVPFCELAIISIALNESLKRPIAVAILL